MSGSTRQKRVTIPGLLLCLGLAFGARAQAPPPAPTLPPELLLPSALLPASSIPPPLAAPPAYLRAVFYATDDDSGVASFRAHADEVSLLAPQCFSLDRYGQLHGSLPAELMAVARAHRVPVMPLVINEGFSRRQAHDFLHDVEARDRAVGALLQTARDNGLAGYQIDFEGLSSTDRDAFSRFIAELGAGLHRHGKILSVAVAARTSEDVTGSFKTYSGVYDYARLAGAADFLSVMAYPEHSGSDPGPLASYPWVEQVIQHELQSIPPDKFSLGVPTYATDWTERRVRISIWRRIGRRLRRFFHWTYHLFGRTQPAADVANHDDLHWDPRLKSSYRAYGSGRHYHVVWVEDARSFAAKLGLARKYHLRGFSVWRLGLEDPAIWARLPAPAAPATALAVVATRPAAPAPVRSVRLPIGASGFAAARAAAPR
ncbi:MAG: glycosyl hydrolase family 18 protein, partial [Terriglobales bacterium]